MGLNGDGDCRKCGSHFLLGAFYAFRGRKYCRKCYLDVKWNRYRVERKSLWKQWKAGMIDEGRYRDAMAELNRKYYTDDFGG